MTALETSIYWILFGIWATLKSYHINGYNLAWSISFFIFNIFVYVVFKFKNRKNVVNSTINVSI